MGLHQDRILSIAALRIRNHVRNYYIRLIYMDLTKFN